MAEDKTKVNMQKLETTKQKQKRLLQLLRSEKSMLEDGANVDEIMKVLGLTEQDSLAMVKKHINDATPEVIDYILGQVTPMIKNGKDGLNGKDGRDGIDGIDGLDGKDGKDGKDGSPDSPEQVVEKVNKSSKKIKKEQVEGLTDVENMVKHQLYTGVSETRVNELIAKIPASSDSGAVDSVNGQTGTVVLDTSDIDPTTDRNYVTDAQQTVIENTSGTNTGDQTLPTRASLGLDTTDTVTFANLSGTNTGDNATNTQYSGLATSKADVGQTFYIGTTQVAINRTSAALTLAGITLTTPDIGTPSAGNLTNCTFPTLNQNTTGSAATLTTTRTIWGQNFNGSANVTGTLALGSSSLTITGSIGATGARATKVWATDIESTNVPTVGGTALPTASSTTTLTNKRINSRLVTAASYTTDTGTSLNIANCDQFEVTAQAGALKFNNPGGTPTGGQKLIIRIKDNGTSRALTYDTQFRASTDLPLPTATTINKTLYMGFVYNATDTKWDLLAKLDNF